MPTKFCFKFLFSIFFLLFSFTLFVVKLCEFLNGIEGIRFGDGKDSIDSSRFSFYFASKKCIQIENNSNHYGVTEILYKLTIKSPDDGWHGMVNGVNESILEMVIGVG